MCKVHYKVQWIGEIYGSSFGGHSSFLFFFKSSNSVDSNVDRYITCLTLSFSQLINMHIKFHKWKKDKTTSDVVSDCALICHVTHI